MLTRLSIIVLTFNQCDVTLRCLDSIAYLGRRDDVEIIVVDNGSTDNTCQRIAERFPAVRTIALDKNYGVAGGRNRGLEGAKGQYLMILDNDTIVPAGAVESLMLYLDSNSDVGLVGPRLIGPDGNVQLSARPYPGILFKIKSLSGMLPQAPSSNADHEPCYVIGAAQMIRREAYAKTGPLDDNIFYGPEDADFCIRIRAAGYRVVYHPQVSIRHEYRRVTRRNPLSRMALRHAAALVYLYRKHHRWL